MILIAVVVWRPQMSGLLWQALAPIVALRDSLGGSQVAQLQDELTRAQAELADRDALVKENTELKSMLGRAPATETPVVAAIVERPPGIPYDTLLLDAGARQGVAVGDTVSAGGSVVVGTISEVHDETSTATLYSAPGSSLAALLVHAATSSEESVPLTLTGQGAGSFMAQVPAGTAVAVGDTIELPGIAGQMPATVSATQYSSGQSFVTVFARLPINLFSLKLVVIATHTR